MLLVKKLMNQLMSRKTLKEKWNEKQYFEPSLDSFKQLQTNEVDLLLLAAHVFMKLIQKCPRRN